MTGRLVGWGYQGRSLDELVENMRTHGATRLVDVRLTPISRVRGFSKGRLRDRLEAEGLTYEHRPELGNPKDNRAGYAEPNTPAANKAHLRYYTEVVDSKAGNREIERLATLIDEDEVIFILCFEREQECCHRAQVIDAVDMMRGPAFCEKILLADQKSVVASARAR